HALPRRRWRTPLPRLAAARVERLAAEPPDAEKSRAAALRAGTCRGTAADDRLPVSAAGRACFRRRAGPLEYLPDGSDRPTAAERTFLAGAAQHQRVHTRHARRAPGCLVQHPCDDEGGRLPARRASQAAAARLE